MREARIMLLHYATGVAAVILVLMHLLARVTLPFTESLTFAHVLSNYRDLLYSSTLELLLITVVIHGANGLRIILIEWRQGHIWESIVKWGMTSVAVALIILGTRTVILARLLL
jgi:succinate dehydrogenase / fumarate reductase membrane anchor subunit